MRRNNPGTGVVPLPDGLLLALGVAALIGMLAGVVPALQAARLDPVEALRDE